MEMHFGHGAIVQGVKSRKWFLVVASVGEDKETWEEKRLYSKIFWRPFCSLLYDHPCLLSEWCDFFYVKNKCYPSQLATNFGRLTLLCDDGGCDGSNSRYTSGCECICHSFNPQSSSWLNTMAKACMLLQTNVFNSRTPLLQLSLKCGIQMAPKTTRNLSE